MDTNKLKGKHFTASYSGGKDSIFAIYRAIKAGLVPLELITTYNTDVNRSWFHGVTENLLQEVSASLAIPVRLIKTPGDQYTENFEQALTKAKEKGAEVCVFGDVDIEGHIEWCTARCEATGLIPFFPLFGENRKKLVYDFIDTGFMTVITIVDTSRMPKNVLGQTLTREIAEYIQASGADICGENGEYHTFTYDGPIFSKAIEYVIQETIERDKYAILNIDGSQPSRPL